MDRGAIQSSPVLCRGLCAGRPVCQERVGTAALCVRQSVQQICARLVAAEAGSARKDGKTALILAAMADQETALVLAASDTDGHCSRGCQHRSTDQPASLRRSRHPERHRSNTYRGVLEDAALVKMLCPYEKELQLADGELPM